jgi:hypothetical protein
MNEEYWITASGKKVAVGNMSEAHVRNALRKVIRESRINKSKDERLHKTAEYNIDDFFPWDGYVDNLRYKGE